MAPHRLKRSMRGALTATAVATAVGVASLPASADPESPGGNPSDAVKQYRDLTRQAEMVTEEKKKAEDDHAAKKAELNRSTAEAGQAELVANQARVEEEKFRGQVDELTNASYQGARLNKMSALLVSESPNDFLDRASALEALAKDNNDAIKRFSGAVHQAESAEKRAKGASARAARAEADAARLAGEITKKKADMDAQIAKVKQQASSLSSGDKDSLFGSDTNEGLIGGSGAAVTAVNAALSKQGSPYVYGAKGPDEFDCSGLTMYAYKQAGVSLPGSTKAQVQAGKSVSEDELKPGDIIFFYSSNSHNGMYIGNGKMVHAPTEGQNVKVEEYKEVGEVNAIRRIAG